MDEGYRLARRVTGVTAGLVLLLAVLGGVVGGTPQAIGVLAGGSLTMANFLWLRWTAGRFMRGTPTPPAGAGRRVVWVVASGARFGVIALALGLVAAQAWVGLGGFLVSLAALPAAVVAEGLRAVRAS